jgi:hypothetical protein
LQSTKTGANAVAASRASNAMKNATTADALDQSNLEVASGMQVPTSTVMNSVAGSMSSPSQPMAADASSRLMQYTQKSRYLAGRAFYLNGNQWVDSNVSSQNNANEVRLKFGSPEYFDFSAKHPEARTYLSLGQNVRLLLANTVYDIYGDSTN